MSKKKRTPGQTPVADELWIAPRYSLKGVHGERAWENRPGGPPNCQRMLELADIALGLKQPEHKKKPRGTTHQLLKTEPYLVQNNGPKKAHS
ncbi:MAG: hypothetical protein WA672_11915 [Candidatus Angelobacter sp.]